MYICGKTVFISPSLDKAQMYFCSHQLFVVCFIHTSVLYIYIYIYITVYIYMQYREQTLSDEIIFLRCYFVNLMLQFSRMSIICPDVADVYAAVLTRVTIGDFRLNWNVLHIDWNSLYCWPIYFHTSSLIIYARVSGARGWLVAGVYEAPCTLWCRYNAISFFSKIVKKTPHSSPVRRLRHSSVVCNIMLYWISLKRFSTVPVHSE